MGLMIISYKIIQKMNYESHGTLAIYLKEKSYTKILQNLVK